MNMNSKKIMLLLGRILLLGLLVLAVILSGRFSGFMNGPGLVFVLLGGAAMALMGFSFREIGTAFKHAAGAPGNLEKLNQSAIFWESSARNFWLLGALGAVISFVLSLGNSTGGIGGIATRMTNSFLPVIYGMIAGVICFVPAMKLKTEWGKLKDSKLSAENNNQEEKIGLSLKFENILGYTLFLLVLGWTILWPLTLKPFEGPLNPLELFLNWPAVLVVAGGTIVLVMFMGNASAGQSFTLSFSFTGLIGSLMGFIQVAWALNSKSINEVAAAITFIISCCFIALLGMMLVAIPLEDRFIKTGRNNHNLTLSRIAWFVFPLVTLFFLALTFILVVTPVEKSG
jgi:hypothetical protein